MKLWHRFYFANGIFSYFNGPIILMLGICGFNEAVNQPRDANVWQFNPRFLISMLLMVGLPKALGIIRILIRWSEFPRTATKDPARIFREVLSTSIELLFSILVAPIVFYMHLRSILEIFTGNSVSWKAQQRSAKRALEWKEAFSMFWVPTLLGSVWGGIAISLAPGYLPYLSFLLFGWVFSIPISVLSSSPALGKWFAQFGFFENALTRLETSEIGGMIPVSAPKLSVKWPIATGQCAGHE
jgi:membrane glycosyltransferase